MDWRIYYADGSTFDSSMGEPHEAPSLGFVAVVAYHPVTGKRYIQQSWDYYFYHTDFEWWGLDTRGLVDWAIDNGWATEIISGNPSVVKDVDGQDLDWIGFTEWCRLNKNIKIGKMVSTDAFATIMDRAHRDSDFPQKG